MTRLTTVTLALALLATGCGSTAGKPVAADKTTTTTKTTPAVTPADLRAGVAAALHANDKLAVQVLWTNRVLASASESTRGPALAGMRSSAQKRQKTKLRVRTLKDSTRIVSIALDPSYLSATAVVQSDERVTPSNLAGTPISKPIQLDERARIDLRRIGTSSRFVVWRLTVLK